MTQAQHKIEIPQLGKISKSPDEDTKKSPDFTADHADERVLLINLRFFKYGTNDKTHAAALAFSLALLVIIIVVIFLGIFSPKSVTWTDKIFNWLGGTFMFVAGIALGGKISNSTSCENEQA